MSKWRCPGLICGWETNVDSEGSRGALCPITEWSGVSVKYATETTKEKK
jgi:hypothetical protein